MSKLAIITGADGGMGTEITRAVAQAGYHVIMLCYTLFKGEERKNQLILETGNKEIEVRQVDLSSMASVTNIAEDLLGRGPMIVALAFRINGFGAEDLLGRGKHIDLLMNNAGTMSSGGLITTEDGLEYTVAVNYVAPFLLTLKLLPLMGQGTRIVNMVSCTYSIGKITPEFFVRGKRGSFWRIPVYSNTKLALWLFTRELSERLKAEGITVNAADPGIVSTNIIRMDMWFDPLTDILFRPCIRTPKQGAATAVSLLLDERWKEVTGQMFASCKPKKVKDKFMNHPQARQLWADTKAYLEKLKLEEPIG